jgi:beta-lactamase regulating signal transducer with metallopeptidase domain
MNSVIEAINSAGRACVAFSLPMLIQSGVLIVVLLLADLVLRRKVRAVFRYWIWMLVLVKLVLPTSLWSPVSVGTWFGGTLAGPELSQGSEPYSIDQPTKAAPTNGDVPVFDLPRVASASDSLPMEMHDARPESPSLPMPDVTQAAPAPIPAPGPSLSWEGLVLLVWTAAVVVLFLLLLERVVFIGRLAAKSDAAPAELTAALDECRRRMQVKRAVTVRISPYASSPAVCGLLRPAILIPQGLASKLRPHEVRAVLMHELAHVKRGDLWINLVQTLLQVAYFYNPLLWLANTMIRRIREQAVDETVLVAMGESADEYPQTLVNIARLALANRPALALRLIGVVESKSALTARIKHILAHPIPKSARLGLLGLLAVLVTAIFLLPMAKGNSLGNWFDRDVLIRFAPGDSTDDIHRTMRDTRVYARDYTVSFRRGETLAIIAELYQVGRPMRVLGCKTFADPGRSERLSARFTMRDQNSERTAIEHSLEITLGQESLRVSGIRVNTPELFSNWDGGFLPVSEIAKKRRDGKTYVEFTNLLTLRVFNSGYRPSAPWLWMPGHQTGPMGEDMYFILVRMLPLSQLDTLQVDVPAGGGVLPDGSHLKVQLPDGSYSPEGASSEQRQAVADEYVLSVKQLVMRDRMPLPKLVTHRYHEKGDPIWITLSYPDGRTWKPDLEELVRRNIQEDTDTFIFLIDGEEYESSWGSAPFAGGGEYRGELPELLNGSTGFHFRPGKHAVAYGWRDLNVVDPNDPAHPLHWARLTTDPVEFEVVEQLPTDYYRPVYQEGWEDILRRGIETRFTDDMWGWVLGPLLALRIGPLPFDAIFAVYVQAEGGDQELLAGDFGLAAGSRLIVPCDRDVKDLNWDTVGDKRWRVILKPSADVAEKYPPIHEFYAKEFVTDWLSFERSPRFEQNRRLVEKSRASRSEASRNGQTVHDLNPNHNDAHLDNSDGVDAVDPTWVDLSRDDSATKPDVSTRSLDANGISATLPNGVTVKLLGLFTGLGSDSTRLDAERDLTWWYPDGTPAPATRFAKYVTSLVLSGGFAYGYLLEFDGAENADITTDVSVGSRTTADKQLPWRLGLVSWGDARGGQLPPIGDIKVVASKEPFKIIEVPVGSPRKPQIFSLETGHRLSLEWGQGEIRATADTDTLNVRLSCKDSNGVSHLLPSARSPYPTAGMAEYYCFPVPDLRQMRSVSIEYRPADIVRFRDVALHPGRSSIVRADVRAYGRVAGNGLGPVGRHALAFEDDDDCLIVPMSESLKLKPPISVEVWARGDFTTLPYPKSETSSGSVRQWPAMVLMRQGAERRDGPAVEDGIVRSPQSGGFIGFLTRNSGALFAVRKDGTLGEAYQQPAFPRPSLGEPPGWTHFSMTLSNERDYLPSEGPLIIGGNLAGKGLAFKGQIAEIRLWSSPLARDVRSAWSMSVTGNEPNLVACWTFDEGSGQVVHDISPNHNDAYLGTTSGVDEADPEWIDLSQEASSGGGE